MKKIISSLIVACFLSVSLASAFVTVRKTITKENLYTDWVLVPAKTQFNLSIRNTSSAIMTIKLQKKYKDSGASGWSEADSWDLIASTPDKEYISSEPEPEPAYYRAGCPTGNYTSGTSTLRIGFE